MSTRSLPRLVAAMLFIVFGAFTQGHAEDAPPPSMDRVEAVRALASTDADRRRAAVFALAENGRMPDVEALLTVLDDDDAPLRAMAERAIWLIWGRHDDPEVRRLLTEGSEQLGARRITESIATFTHVIELAPDFAEGWNKRATAYFLAGDMKASLHDCDEVLLRNPNHFGALSGYGLIYTHLGEPERALDFFQRALALNPNMAGVRNNIEALRQQLAKHGRHET
ncbi:MAG: tetratricopeptide repeat protein [Burkholderiales bacterium]